jgi:hypothetical protein
MINTIIFSFNRAIQLDLLLRSIVKHDEKKMLGVSVLYACSEQKYEQGYEVLKERFPQVQFIREEKFAPRFVPPFFPLYWHNYFWWLKYKHTRTVSGNFRKQLINLVADSEKEYVMFLTDDSMFYKPISILQPVLADIRRRPLHNSFSLRHGTNIMGGNFSYRNALLSWNVFEDHDHPEWSHPFSVDGHIYSKRFILKAFRKVWFKNPNTLECNVACYVKEKKFLSSVFSNKKSALVGFELNRMQDINENHNLNIDSNYLNGLFNEGYHMRISFDENTNQLFRPSNFRVDVCRERYLINIVDTQ